MPENDPLRELLLAELALHFDPAGARNMATALLVLLTLIAACFRGESGGQTSPPSSAAKGRGKGGEMGRRRRSRRRESDEKTPDREAFERILRQLTPWKCSRCGITAWSSWGMYDEVTSFKTDVDIDAKCLTAENNWGDSRLNFGGYHSLHKTFREIGKRALMGVPR
jgi:hypothetical protein